MAIVDKISNWNYKELPKAVTNEPQDHFRVGVTKDGKTSLTIISQDGYQSTLTMNQVACEQLIRMLRATYLDDVKE